MEFIELQEGISVNKKSIDAIERIEDGGTRVYMRSGSVHESTFPYFTLLKLIEITIDKEPEQRNNGIMNTEGEHAQFFAG